MFLPHFDIFSDVLLKRPTATWYLSLLHQLLRMMSSMHQSSKRSKVRTIQIKENAMIYLQNRFYFDVKPTFRHTFPSSNLQCLPRGDPRNLCANTRIPSLATHSSCVQLNLLYTYLLRQNVMNCALLNSSGKEDEKTQELPLLISMKIKCLYLN